ncbi:MAG: hypothetical protein ACREJ3_04830, partial [Polyangiaceae bacterium]
MRWSSIPVLSALATMLAGCAHAFSATSALSTAHREKSFSNNTEKIIACLDLRDHAVDLYAGEYLSRAEVTLTSAERTAFRDGWAEELASRGTFERFNHSCFGSLTPGQYDCGMRSQTT